MISGILGACQAASLAACLAACDILLLYDTRQLISIYICRHPPKSKRSQREVKRSQCDLV